MYSLIAFIKPLKCFKYRAKITWPYSLVMSGKSWKSRQIVFPHALFLQAQLIWCVYKVVTSCVSLKIWIMLSSNFPYVMLAMFGEEYYFWLLINNCACIDSWKSLLSHEDTKLAVSQQCFGNHIYQKCLYLHEVTFYMQYIMIKYKYQVWSASKTKCDKTHFKQTPDICM